MGRLVDQDYLWLRENRAAVGQTSRWRRWLPFVVVPLAGLGVWIVFYTQADTPLHDTVAAPADNPIHAGQLINAVAYSNDQRAHLSPVNLSQSAGPGGKAILDDAKTPDPIASLTMAPAADLDLAALDDKPGWRTLHIAQGDTLSLAFERQGLSYMDSLRIAHLPKLGHFFTSGLKTGGTMHVQADAKGRVQSLVYPIDAGRTVIVTRCDDAHFNGSLSEQALTHHATFARGAIQHSFYNDARAAGLSASQIATLHRILAHKVNFSRDMRRGDRFTVLFDELYHDGHRVGTGPIRALSLDTRDGPLRAICYTDTRGHTEYYRPDGQPMRHAFVRAPVDYTRISSPFSLNRRHPILHHIRRHEGTDYAAPEGAPIHATGAGVVVFRGRRGGYGNVVILRHDRHITMRFAHMSRFALGLSVGDHVDEGQLIGYVGMTGLATGPHVHYEFRVDGKPRNPQTVPLPGAMPLSGTALARFQRASGALVAALEHHERARDIQLADATSATGQR